jgi:UPF0755 protein
MSERDDNYDAGRVPDPIMPKRRRSVFSRVFSSLFLIGLAALVVGGIAAFIGYQEFTAPGPLVQQKIYEIDRGLDTRQMAAKLQEQGIISDARIFTAAAYAGNLMGARLKAGEYAFPANASMDEVLGIITSGRAITYKLTIPEGWTSEMAVNRLRENEVLTGEIVTVPPEGAIRPDTYVFKRGMTRQKLLEDMQAAQTKLVDELWAARVPNDLIKTKEDAIILASIVEKETGRGDERAEVAAVFLNRLREGMRLQSDPTIIYGIAGGKGRLDRPITKSDIATSTPYNTYTIDGLPPGPIANPGAAAIEAVLNPPESKNLYFVADGTGGHAFAETLDEHNANVAKWRAIEPTMDQSAAADQAAAAEPPAAAAPATEEPAPSDALVASVDAPAANLDGVVEGQAVAPVAPEGIAPTGDDAAAAQPEPIPAPSTDGDQTATAEPAPAPKATGSTGQQAAAAQLADTLKPEDKQEPAPAAAVEETEILTAKPGTVMRVAGRSVPIPKQKPKRRQ